MKKIIITILILIFLAAALSVGYVIYDNCRVEVTEYTYSSERVPKNFDGYRICCITDFHSGKNYEKVAEKVRAQNPDIICIVGDLVNMDDTDFTNAKALVKELCDIGKVYFSYGNHEVWSNTVNKTETPLIYDALKDLPVTFMNREVRTIDIDGQLINLIGYGDDVYDDFDGLFDMHAKERLTAIHNTLDPSVLSILMLHRAQYFETASDIGYDMVLSGHLHGGQINLPKFQPYILEKHFGTTKYSKGEYDYNDSKMYVCGGLANKNNIPRIFNTPEIMVVELDAK